MNANIPAPLSPRIPETDVLTVLESLPADLRGALGWRRLFGLTLDAVLGFPPRELGESTQTPLLLTLITYSYAANLLCSEDIEAACFNEADVAFITGGAAIWAAEVRRFRRHHRPLIEACLSQVFAAAVLERADRRMVCDWDVSVMASGVSEFARRRVNLAVLFDTAMSE